MYLMKQRHITKKNRIHTVNNLYVHVKVGGGGGGVSREVIDKYRHSFQSSKISVVSSKRIRKWPGKRLGRERGRSREVERFSTR